MSVVSLVTGGILTALAVGIWKAAGAERGAGTSAPLPIAQVGRVSERPSGAARRSRAAIRLRPVLVVIAVVLVVAAILCAMFFSYLAGIGEIARGG